MKRLALFAILLAWLAVGPASAAYLLEIDTDGMDDGVLTFNPNFSFCGDTTTASQSAASSAFGMTGGDSIFGGDGVDQLDCYGYVYSPDSEADNLDVPAGTDLGDGNTGTGIVGGGAGTYTVYATWPFTSNVSGGLTTYNVTSDIDNFSVEIDQNGGGAGLGNVWVKLGEIEYAAGSISVEQLAGENTFVSMRAAGVMFEGVPEPATGILFGIALVLFGVWTRRPL